MDNIEIWIDDKLDRQGDADFLERLLRNNAQDLAARGIKKSFVLNLDAGWGRGKTFFLTRLKQQLEASGHLAAYVNAWEDDFADDPLTAVMAAIDEVVSSNVEKTSTAAKTWRATKEAAGKVAIQAGKGLLIRGLGMLLTEGVAAGVVGAVGAVDAETSSSAIADEATKAIDKIIEDKMSKSVSDFVASKRIIAEFKARLVEFVNQIEEAGKARPFFILVDELDRCRPPYAIAMLERIKHLFDVPEVVFIVSTDNSQLAETIRGVYGGGFDSPRYLKRFFDSTFEFDTPDTAPLVTLLLEETPLDQSLFSVPGRFDLATYLSEFFTRTHTDPRTVKQQYQLLRTITQTWTLPAQIEVAVMLPMIASYYKQPNIFELSMRDSVTMKLKTEWPMRVRNPETGQWSESSVSDLGATLWEATEKSLQRSLSEHNFGWASERLNAELQARGSAGRLTENARSYIRDYPRIIRQAGRVSD